MLCRKKVCVFKRLCQTLGSGKVWRNLFDTDVEVIRSLEELLRNDAFFCFENKQYVASGLGFGSVAHGKVIQAMLKEYEILLDGKNGVRMCPKIEYTSVGSIGVNKNG